MPTPLPQISSRAWEHPADRAALIQRLSREKVLSDCELHLKRKDGSGQNTQH